jgi:hypothetical protein
MESKVGIIYYGQPLEGIEDRSPESEPMISTVPAPVMMKLSGWKDVPQFDSRRVWSITSTLTDCDVFQTIYYPDLDLPFYRASITGNVLTIECLAEPSYSGQFTPDMMVLMVAADFGILGTQLARASVKVQKYGKISPIEDPALMRRFILWLTDRYRIYSVGRFALWRQLLLDDVVADIRVVERLIECRDAYQHALGMTKL